MPCRRPTSNLAVGLLIGLLSLGVNLAAAAHTGFNPDESRWIHRAHFLGDIRHPRGPTWDDSYEARGQPPLGSFATGLGLLLQGRDLATNGPWNYAYQGTRGWHQNIADGNMPAPADLAAARRTSAFLAAATVVVIFALLLRLTSRFGATVGALALGLHPFHAYIGSLATADALLGLLIAAAALAAARLADRPGWRNALLLGALLGLGGATKLSPLLVTFPLCALGALLLLRSPGRRPPRALGRWIGIRNRGQPWPSVEVDWEEGEEQESPAHRRPLHPLAPMLLSLPLVAALTFVAVSPFLWPDPIGRTYALYAFRATEMATQAGDWPEMAVGSRAEALRRVGLTFHDRYSYAAVARVLIERTAGPALQAPAVEICLVLVGALLFAARAIRAGPAAPLLVFIVLASQVGITLAGMRSEFDRYHVPMALGAAVSVGLLVGHLAPLVSRHSARPTPWRRSTSTSRRPSTGTLRPPSRADPPRFPIRTSGLPSTKRRGQHQH